MLYECAICHNKFKQITGSHLKSHSITRAEYIKQFGNEGVQNTIRFGSTRLTEKERVAKDYVYDRVIKAKLK